MKITPGKLGSQFYSKIFWQTKKNTKMQLKCLIEVMGTFGEKQSFGSGIDLKQLVFPAVHA